MSHQDAHAWLKNKTVKRIWKKLNAFELSLEKGLKTSEQVSRKYRRLRVCLEIFDLLLKAPAHNKTRPIDFFDSPIFPSPQAYRLRTRDLIFPHRTCHLFEPRKSHALLLGLIDGDIEAMGFHPTQQPPLRVLQDAMFEDAYAALEAHLFECLKLS